MPHAIRENKIYQVPIDCEHFWFLKLLQMDEWKSKPNDSFYNQYASIGLGAMDIANSTNVN